MTVPRRIRDLATFDPDYADCCTVTTGDGWDRSPEQSARAVLEATPLGRRARVLWQGLGLRLGPTGSPDHVQGWRIADRGDTWIRLDTDSWCLTAEAVFQLEGGRLSLALFLRYDRPIASRIWAPVSVIHRQAVPQLLDQAVTTTVDA